MRIVNLIENTKGSSGCACEHGLSFYIEALGHKLLVDAGATNAFIENAAKLNVDLTQVDMMILSHGHYDHAGGILGFAALNPDAPIYMQAAAGGAYYHKNDKTEKYIGIDPRILELPQVKLINGNQRLGEGIFLFSGVTGRKLWPQGNLELKRKEGDRFYQDEFFHEQYLVLEEKGKNVLISGCAHNGILNILEEYARIYGRDPDVVISGFHMYKKSDYTEEELAVVKKTAWELKETQTVFYTGHCTGEIPYQVMKECMGLQLRYVHSGDEISL